MRVGREQFLRSLELVSPGLTTEDTKKSVDQSDCFVFRGGRVYTFDGKVCCRGPSPLDKDLKCAVRGKALLEMLRKLSGNEVDVSLGDGKFVVKAQGRESVELSMEAEVSLPVGEVEKPGEFSLLPKDFSKGVSMVVLCAAASDKARWVLTTVHLAEMCMEASDDVQACRYTIKLGLKQDTVVQQKALASVLKLGATSISETTNWVHFKNPVGAILSCCRYVEHDFPSEDIENALNFEGELLELPEGLAAVARKALVLSDENDKKEDKRVTVELREGELLVIGQGLSGRYTKKLKVKYKGGPRKFLIFPKVLADLSGRDGRCTVSDQLLKVEGNGWQYLTCLGVIE